MKHEMNPHRRAVFEQMDRDNKRYGPIKRGREPLRSFFENDVMGREMALNMERLGWLSRHRSSTGTVVRLTDVGLWILGGVS